MKGSVSALPVLSTLTGLNIMSTDYEVSERYKENNTIPDSVTKAENYLRRNHGSFWYRFSGYRNSKNINDLYEMHNWCDIHKIKWIDIQPFILLFINCKVDDQPKRSYTKKLYNYRSKKGCK